ncbi:MAG: tRNA (N6-isopentenyl adenosine(37)-C2)-methylthiotransferase MiaB [Oscillospiraceae bacterium]|nr:tRNA (N6-isopentenyl adenosine(37)-C2)-methylthiotransferase MiaB [Oscillospiraceae bacterium]
MQNNHNNELEFQLTGKLAFIRTFGCRANVSDSEKISGMLAELGYGFTRNMEEADLILFNTCAVRENAETRVFGNVGALIHLKRKNPDLIIAVCGCMVQQEHITKKLYDTYPFVSLIFGTHVLHKLPELLKETLSGKRVINIDNYEHIITEDLPIKREVEKPEGEEGKIKADVSIMYGCDNYCSYCIVPYVRGRERSRKPTAILNEIQMLIMDGYKEITLLGQNVNSYAGDSESGDKITFAELLKQIESISGEFRVSYMTSHPKDLTKDVIDVIANSEKISYHLHLPVQAGSNRVLEVMNRGYTIEQYLQIVEYARSKILDVSLTTDIIVGFPGETREEFLETLNLLERVKFDSAFTFIYSKREGTKAAEMDDTVSSEEKSAWFTEMLDVLDKVSGDAYERFVGKTLRVLCEGVGRTGEYEFSGRSREGVIVEFNASSNSEAHLDTINHATIIGEFVDVKINKALKWAVIGELSIVD